MHPYMIKGKWSAHPITAASEQEQEPTMNVYAVRLLRDLQNGFVCEISDLAEYMNRYQLQDETIALERLQRDLRHREKSNRIFVVKASSAAHAVLAASQKA